MKGRTGCLIAVALVVLAPVIAWQAFIYSWYQGVLPLGVDAPLVTYRKTESYGVGPGGDAAGILVYRMTEATAARIAQGGVAYLNASAAENGRLLTIDERQRRSRRVYSDWRPTPVDMERFGDGHGEDRCGGRPGIRAYLGGFSFRCRVRRSILDKTDRLLSMPGAFYGSRNHEDAIVIVSPKTREVVFAYRD